MAGLNGLCHLEDPFSHGEDYLCLIIITLLNLVILFINQRTSGPVNAHLLSRPSKAQNIQNLENIW